MKGEKSVRLTECPHPQPLSHPMGEGGVGFSPERSGSESGTSGAIAVEPYIDKHEVARRLGKTTRTVDNMMRRGMLPYYKLGYRVAFRWSEIQNHLAQTYRVCRQG